MLHDILIYTPMYVTLFWAIVLVFQGKKKNLSKFYLGLFMFTAFFLYVSHAIFFNGEQELYLYFDPIYTFCSLMVYPLYYIYIKILGVDSYFKKKNLLYFIPAFIISLTTFIIYLLMPVAQRANYIDLYFFNSDQAHLESPLQNAQRFVFYMGRVIFSIQVVYFLIKGMKLINNYNKQVANFYSNIEGKSIVWVHVLLLSFVLTSLMSIVFNIIGKHYFFETPLLLAIPSVIFSFLLFVIGFQGYQQNHTVLDLIHDKNKEVSSSTIQSNKEIIKKNMLTLFEVEKIFRNNDLKITDISNALNTNRTYISQIINTDFANSFHDFVNQYRIQEAKRILKEKTSNNYTLEYISDQVGFGSLHTFIRVFKKYEGQTPGNFRKNN